jgi:hypothetical protein
LPPSGHRGGGKKNNAGETRMKSESSHRLIKGVAIAVLALMLVAALYSAYMSIANWHGIGV